MVFLVDRGLDWGFCSSSFSDLGAEEGNASRVASIVRRFVDVPWFLNHAV